MKRFLVALLVIFIRLNASNLTVTNPYRSDGFGSQFLILICSVVYAEINSLDFVYTPFVGMEHNYNNDPLFLDKKESFINFKRSFKLNDGSAMSLDLWDVVIDFMDNSNEYLQSESLQKIKRIFREGKQKSDYFDESHFNIAVHIRRLNSHDSTLVGTDILDCDYLSYIQKLKAQYSSQDPIIHIYSQGDLSSFKETYADKNVVFHINESVEETFGSFVFADVLLTTSSTLSYTAGLLSDGIVHYIPFWYPPATNWQIMF